jgi:hypothetical protein
LAMLDGRTELGLLWLWLKRLKTPSSFADILDEKTNMNAVRAAVKFAMNTRRPEEEIAYLSPG